MKYDSNNIFAKIIRGELPCDKVYEDDYVLAFHDIHPKAPIHVLVIPKGEYTTFDDFCQNASAEEMKAFFSKVGQIARDIGIEEKGYRVIANHKQDSGQEVYHFHVHILGGRFLGPMISPVEK